MSAFPKVKRDQTVRLVPHIPFVISWLRHSEPRAADLFLGAAKNVDDDEVQQTWKQILDQFDIYGDLSTAQLRLICKHHETPVWARAILTLFTGSDPRIVPQKVSLGLFKAVGKIKDLNNGSDVAQKLAPELDKMKLVCRDSLGELCALVRDTSLDPRYTAASLGPSILLSEGYDESGLVLASRVMNAMVEHADLVFGKAGTRSNFDALGVRRHDYQQQEEQFESESQISARSRPAVNQKEMADALSEAGFM